MIITKDHKETHLQSPKESHNWLASFLLHQGEPLLCRLAYFYKQLQALPSHTRRNLQKKLALPLAGIALMLALSNTSSVYAANISVTPGATGFNPGDGCSLVEAIDNANNDAAVNTDCIAGTGADVITLAGNTYSYNYTGNSGVVLPTINSNLTIEGNGATIVNNQPSSSTFRILEVLSSNGNLTLNHTTISGGRYENGGGIYSKNSTLTLNNSIVSGNSAQVDGGAMLIEGSIVTLNNSTVSENSAGDDAAGIFAGDSNLTINNSIISDNSSDDSGGGITNFYSILTVNNSTISENSARIGGGIAASGITTLNNSTVSGNTTSGPQGGGGIINMTLTYSSNPQITLTLNNSTISGNSARRGGGITNLAYEDGSSIMTLNNSTVSYNYARIVGGGILNLSQDETSTSISRLNKSIVAQNYGDDDCYYYNSGPIISQGYNIIGNNDTCISAPLLSDQVGTASSPLDAMLKPLADNGGPTWTHALDSGSPAIDKVPNDPSPDAIDQRGAARDFDNNPGDANTTALGDIGAFERRGAITIGGVDDCDSAIGPDLSGEQTFEISATSIITVDVTTANGLKCIKVEEMGINHPFATGPGATGQGIKTNNWWHISGNIDNGFDVDITLPYSSANASSRVCKWPGNLGGAGWDCGDGTDNDPIGNSVKRSGLASFSDWAVGDNVGPTSVNLQDLSATNTSGSTTAAALASLSLMLGSLWWSIRKRK